MPPCAGVACARRMLLRALPGVRGAARRSGMRRKRRAEPSKTRTEERPQREGVQAGGRCEARKVRIVAGAVVTERTQNVGGKCVVYVWGP